MEYLEEEKRYVMRERIVLREGERPGRTVLTKNGLEKRKLPRLSKKDDPDPECWSWELNEE